jgi:hypothetical protein
MNALCSVRVIILADEYVQPSKLGQRGKINHGLLLQRTKPTTTSRPMLIDVSCARLHLSSPPKVPAALSFNIAATHVCTQHYVHRRREYVVEASQTPGIKHDILVEDIAEGIR